MSDKMTLSETLKSIVQQFSKYEIVFDRSGIAFAVEKRLNSIKLTVAYHGFVDTFERLAINLHLDQAGIKGVSEDAIDTVERDGAATTVP